MPDAASLDAELAARWPDAVGGNRADTDETHRLVLLHPRYDGFVSLTVTARTDLDAVFVIPDSTLVEVVTAHHRTGPLERGQELPIDVELHPGKVHSPASSGLLELVDASGEPVAPPVRVTLATDPRLECELAGAVEGPFQDEAAFERVVEQLRAGRGSTRRLAHRISRLHAGRSDPGWSRLPWREA